MEVLGQALAGDADAVVQVVVLGALAGVLLFSLVYGFREGLDLGRQQRAETASELGRRLLLQQGARAPFVSEIDFSFIAHDQELGGVVLGQGGEARRYFYAQISAIALLLNEEPVSVTVRTDDGELVIYSEPPEERPAVETLQSIILVLEVDDPERPSHHVVYFPTQTGALSAETQLDAAQRQQLDVAQAMWRAHQALKAADTRKVN